MKVLFSGCVSCFARMLGRMKSKLECLRGDQGLNVHTRQLVTTRSTVGCKQGPHIGYTQHVWSCVCSGKCVCEREREKKITLAVEIFSFKKYIQVCVGNNIFTQVKATLTSENSERRKSGLSPGVGTSTGAAKTRLISFLPYYYTFATVSCQNLTSAT